MSEMEIIVEPAESFEDYEEAWLACMNHVHWIEDRGPFDYHSDEELEEIQEEFDKPENTFLVARLDDDDEIVGVLGITSDDKMTKRAGLGDGNQACLHSSGAAVLQMRS